MRPGFLVLQITVRADALAANYRASAFVGEDHAVTAMPVATHDDDGAAGGIDNPGAPQPHALGLIERTPWGAAGAVMMAAPIAAPIVMSFVILHVYAVSIGAEASFEGGRCGRGGGNTAQGDDCGKSDPGEQTGHGRSSGCSRFSFRHVRR
jgi:hypothetical protein